MTTKYCTRVARQNAQAWRYFLEIPLERRHLSMYGWTKLFAPKLFSFLCEYDRKCPWCFRYHCDMVYWYALTILIQLHTVNIIVQFNMKIKLTQCGIFCDFNLVSCSKRQHCLMLYKFHPQNIFKTHVGRTTYTNKYRWK